MEIPWHPVLFAAAIVIGQYLGQIIAIQAVVRPLVLFMLGAALLTLIVGLLLRGLQRGALATAVMLLAWRSPHIEEQVVATVGVVGLIAGLILTLRRVRIARPVAELTRVLNVLSISLIVVLLANIVVGGRLPEIAADLSAGLPPSRLPSAPPDIPHVDRMSPDIYLVMLDGYPRADTLQRLFGFDNADFLAALEERGLDVADRSRSNYMYSALTLTSVLNTALLSDIPGIDGERTLRLMINHNAVFDEFRSRGYVVAATAAGWEAEAMRGADVYCGGDTMNDFELNLIAPTLPGRLAEIALPELVPGRDRAQINGALACLTDFARAATKGPKLVFAHIPSPHLPIVFSADGTPAAPEFYGHTRQGVRVPDDAYACTSLCR